MAAQLVLIRNSTGHRVNLVELDDEICRVLDVQADPNSFYAGWMDSIGMMLAFGRDYDYVRENIKGYFYEVELGRVLDYLETYFTNNSHFTR